MHIFNLGPIIFVNSQCSIVLYFVIFRWHLGYCNEKFLPNNRGFDSFFGYLNGAEVNNYKIFYNFLVNSFFRRILIGFGMFSLFYFRVIMTKQFCTAIMILIIGIFSSTMNPTQITIHFQW